jgi:hypothetical protein
VRRGNRLGVRLQPAEGVEHAAVLLAADQGAFVMLAVDLHQGRTDLLQQGDAARLVIDEGARLASRVCVRRRISGPSASIPF